MSSSSPGHVTLVGAGPGDPELLTLKAVRAIQAASVILVDDLVGDGVLAHARPDARITYVGKRGGCQSTPQATIEQLMLQAARLFLYAAASRLDRKAPDASKWSAMAKRLVTDTGFAVANDALQLLGGYGYLHDYGVEKLVRDLRVHQILEGTNEIMRVIVARHLIGRQ